MSKAIKKKKVTPVKTEPKEKVVMKIRDAHWNALYNNCLVHTKALKEKGVKDVPKVSRKMSKSELQKIFNSMHGNGKLAIHFK